MEVAAAWKNVNPVRRAGPEGSPQTRRPYRVKLAAELEGIPQRRHRSGDPIPHNTRIKGAGPSGLRGPPDDQPGWDGPGWLWFGPAAWWRLWCGRGPKPRPAPVYLVVLYSPPYRSPPWSPDLPGRPFLYLAPSAMEVGKEDRSDGTQTRPDAGRIAEAERQ